jgi:hypothetical protein
MKVFATGVYKIRTAFDQYQSIGNSWSGDLKMQLECGLWAEMEFDHRSRNFNWLKKR